MDSKDCLHAWAENLGGITYPLLSDFWPHGAIAQKFGVLRSEGYSERAIFIVDRTGIVRYVDVHDIDDQPDNEILFRELAEIEGVPVPQEIITRSTAPSISTEVTTEVAASEVEPVVTMYCTDWCPACRRARAYFKINEVPFREINISRDRQAAADVRQFTGGYETTPTFNVKGTIVVNFDVEKINKLLGIAG